MLTFRSSCSLPPNLRLPAAFANLTHPLIPRLRQGTLVAYAPYVAGPKVFRSDYSSLLLYLSPMAEYAAPSATPIQRPIGIFPIAAPTPRPKAKPMAIY